MLFAVAIGLAGLFGFQVHYLRISEGFLEKAVACAGKDQASVRKVMGDPEGQATNSKEKEQLLSDVTISYEPDPMSEDCDEIWSYRVPLRIVLLYFKDGKVVRIYTGLT